MDDAGKDMIERAIKLYYERKKWHWKVRLTQNEMQTSSVLTPPPPIQFRLQDIEDISDSEEISDEFEDS